VIVGSSLLCARCGDSDEIHERGERKKGRARRRRDRHTLKGKKGGGSGEAIRYLSHTQRIILKRIDILLASHTRPKKKKKP